MRSGLVAEAVGLAVPMNRTTVPKVVLVGIVAAGLTPSTACLQRPVDNPNIIVVGMPSGPASLDPRIGTDDTSQKAGQLIFSSLMTLDDHLRIVPQLAERLDNPEPTTYVVTLRRGVRFHDGHELTSADVVHTYRSILSPDFISPIKGAFGLLKAVDARDRYTVVFTLTEPFGSFAANLVVPPIVSDGADSSFHEHPIGTGPYRFVRYLSDDRLELTAFDDYYEGRPRNDGIVLRVIPDDIMRGLELRKGTMDLSVNDLAPDIVYQLQREPALQVVSSPGTDYQYIGLNLRDPILRDRRVRQALAYAIDYKAIVEHLRRGLATPASGIMPPMSWAFEPDVFTFTHDPGNAKRLLDEAGYGDPDGDGPRPRFTLSLKVSNIEFNRLQSAVIQQNLRDVGIRLDVWVYEFATLYTDVLNGSFQMFSLQWTGGATADPDILRRIFHSRQTPPFGFNRGYFANPRVDRLLDEATVSTDMAHRRRLFGEVQQIVAREVPYISLWDKTNFAVAQRALSGIRLTPAADFLFLKDVMRSAPDHQAAH
jgi:peptide/nickel transport system substrate-binding protein